MNTVNICDTSAIIKLYHDEAGSGWNETAKDFRVICADANLLKVCEREGVTVINPEFQGVDA